MENPIARADIKYKICVLGRHYKPKGVEKFSVHTGAPIGPGLPRGPINPRSP